MMNMMTPVPHREILHKATDTHPELKTITVYVAQDCTGTSSAACSHYKLDIIFIDSPVVDISVF